MAETDPKQMTEQEYLASRYGDFFVDEFAEYERTIEDDYGNQRTIWLRKFSEENVQEREEVMIDQSGMERSAKNQRRQANKGNAPQIKVKPSHRRRFDIIRGVKKWDLTRIKRDKDGDLKWVMEDGEPKVDENGFRVPQVEKVEPSVKEKMKLSAFVSEQMIRAVRKLNDLPIEDEDEDADRDEEPADSGPKGDFDTDYEIEGFGDDSEEEESENVTPLPKRKAKSSSTQNSGKSATSGNKQSSGSSS